MRFATMLAGVLLLAGCQTVPAPEASKPEILAASRAWADAFNACNVPRIVALYDREAVVWGTTGQAILSSPEGVRQYFSAVCGAPVRPRVEFGDQLVRVHGDIALNSGSYTFVGPKGGQFPARYSFVYRRIEGRWLIIDFHSSFRPAPPKPAAG